MEEYGTSRLGLYKEDSMSGWEEGGMGYSQPVDWDSGRFYLCDRGTGIFNPRAGEGEPILGAVRREGLVIKRLALFPFTTNNSVSRAINDHEQGEQS